MTDFNIVIPARFASSRLPGKPLMDIGGKSMIERVYQNCHQTRAQLVLVATDDERVAAEVRSFGGNVVMTSEHHQNGTERLAEVMSSQPFKDDDIVVNVQGDEPLLSPKYIELVAAALSIFPEAQLATLATPLKAGDELLNPNIVKVVRDERGFAHYFSRAPIPWDRDAFDIDKPAKDWILDPTQHLRHIGLYAYRVGVLKKLAQSAPAPTEKLEFLEQLRALYLGLPIHVTVVDEAPAHGVDTAEDLERVRKIYAN